MSIVKLTIMKAAGMALLLVGIGSVLSATSVPEIDATSAGNALALFGGVLLVMRSRKR
jgi:hypothetical protein